MLSLPPSYRIQWGKVCLSGHTFTNPMNKNLETSSAQSHTLRCFCYPITILFYSINQGCRAGPQVVHWPEFSPRHTQLQGSPVDKHNLFWCHSTPPAEHSVPPWEVSLSSNHHPGHIFSHLCGILFILSLIKKAQMLRLLIKRYEIFLCTTFSQTRGRRDTVLPCFEMVDGTL